jgi:hypothetical protein
MTHKFPMFVLTENNFPVEDSRAYSSPLFHLVIMWQEGREEEGR